MSLRGAVLTTLPGGGPYQHARRDGEACAGDQDCPHAPSTAARRPYVHPPVEQVRIAPRGMSDSKRSCSMTTRGLILAHAEHDRSPPAPGQPRHLMPVANKPILFHALESMAAAGIADVAITVTAEEEATVAKAVDSGDRWGLSVSYQRAERSDGVLSVLLA